MSKIGLIDADLLDNGTRHPNLALMKISGFYKSQGHRVSLITDINLTSQFDKVFVSKVFSYTSFPGEILKRKNVLYGGSGFYPDGDGPSLESSIEHHMPDYNLYEPYINSKIASGVKASFFKDYRLFSIGFLTRGCFRKCEFCINKKYDRVMHHSHVQEFMDSTRKYIYLWDDNVLGFSKWKEVFDELKATQKYFQFRQGLDIRVMTLEKAKTLANSRYYGDYIFAFDDIAEKKAIVKGLDIWKRYARKTTKLYLLCAYKSTDISDITELFERIALLMRYQCLPYIMRYESYKTSAYKQIYTAIARWCNQPHIFKKMSFREFCLAHMAYSKQNTTPSIVKAFYQFEEMHPKLIKKYADLKYMNFEE